MSNIVHVILEWPRRDTLEVKKEYVDSKEVNCFFLFFLVDTYKVYSLLQHIFRLLIFIFLDSKEHTAQKMKF